MGSGASAPEKKTGASVNLYWIMNLPKLFIDHVDKKECYNRYGELINSRCIGGNFTVDHLLMKIISKRENITIFNNDLPNPKIKFLFGLDDIDEKTNVLIDRKTSDHLEHFMIFLGIKGDGYVKLLVWPV